MWHQQKQELFCKAYIVDYNATNAAKRAGYSEKTAGSIGSENLKKPEILARVRELQAEKLEKSAISQAFVITEILETYRKSIEEKDFKSALKALEMLGRHASKDGKDKDNTIKNQLNAILEQLNE